MVKDEFSTDKKHRLRGALREPRAYHAAVFETHEPYRLFVANDCGLWMTGDFAVWTDVSTTLPNAMTSDLVYHHRDRSLTAATYGRGVWRVIL